MKTTVTKTFILGMSYPFFNFQLLLARKAKQLSTPFLNCSLGNQGTKLDKVPGRFRKVLDMLKLVSSERSKHPNFLIW